MKRAYLNDLVCPAMEDGKRCYGQLRLSEGVIPLIYTNNNPLEVLEGIVCCQRCGEEYPIICGVLILVNEVKTYLARYYSEIMSAAAHCDISKAMVAHLQRGGYDLHDTGFQNSFWTNAWGMSIYICAHYDTLANMLEHSHPLKDLLQQDFYVKILAMIDKAPGGILGEEGRAIDIGCNVGGMSWRLAERCKFVYGIDISFRAVLTARQIILGQPQPLKNYRLYQEGLLYEERSFSVPQRQNCELFVASGLDLPFKNLSFEFVNCGNVVDEISHPSSLLWESFRVLKKGGGFLLTDPYFWSLQRTPIESWFGAKTGKFTAAALKDELIQMGTIVGEEEKLPWILRVYNRYFTVYFSHCILMQKNH